MSRPAILFIKLHKYFFYKVLDIFPKLRYNYIVPRKEGVSSQQKEMLVSKAPNEIKQENVVQDSPKPLTFSKSCAIIRMNLGTGMDLKDGDYYMSVQASI